MNVGSVNLTCNTQACKKQTPNFGAVVLPQAYVNPFIARRAPLNLTKPFNDNNNGLRGTLRYLLEEVFPALKVCTKGEIQLGDSLIGDDLVLTRDEIRTVGQIASEVLRLKEAPEMGRMAKENLFKYIVDLVDKAKGPTQEQLDAIHGIITDNHIEGHLFDNKDAMTKFLNIVKEAEGSLDVDLEGFDSPNAPRAATLCFIKPLSGQIG